MLTEQQLTKLMDDLHLDDEARSIVRHIRSSPPARRAGSSAKNVVCRYPSKKMGCTIQAESHTNELPAIYLWDHDDITHEFYDQPPKIKLSYKDKDGKRRAHLTVPDFFLIQENFIGWVECKPEDWLQRKENEGSTIYEQASDGSWRCPPGEAYAYQFGLGFKLRSSSETPQIYVRNLTFLADYLAESCKPPSAYERERVKTLMAGKSWVYLAELVGVNADCDVDAVFKLIADEVLIVDLYKNLLAEPETTKVFRDHITAEAYRHQQQAITTEPLPLVHPIRIEPGEAVTWDGIAFKIKTVGENFLFLEDGEGKIEKLLLDQFQALVRAGVMRGIPVSAESLKCQAEEVVQGAGPKDMAKAVARYELLGATSIQNGGSGKSVSPRTLRYWKQLQRMGESLYGDGFVGLISRICNRGNTQRKIDPDVLALMNKVIDEDFRGPEAQSKKACYSILVARCRDAGLIPPSHKSFLSEIRRNHTEHDLAKEREGERAAYKHEPFVWVLDHSTPRHGDRAFEVGHIDHTELDLQFIGSKYGENMGRAWLTVLLDAHTRMVLACVITFDPPSFRSCMLVLRECVKRHGRVPSIIVVDNGSDFNSLYFEVLLGRLAITKKTRPPHCPKFGSVMERFFGVSCQQLIHNLCGNNKPLQKARQMSSTHDPRKTAVWTLAEFTPVFERYVYEVYASLEHSALGVSPKTAFEVSLAKTGFRNNRVIPYTKDFELLCMPSTPKKTAKIECGKGVKIGYLRYFHPLFRDPKHAGKDVPVRYDPYDLSRAFVYLERQWLPCQSENAALFHNKSERQIAIISREIKGRHRQGGKRQLINAEILGRYLIQLKDTEAVLRQQKMDAEYRLAQGIPDVSHNKASEVSTHAPDNGVDTWANLPTRPLEEFI